MEMRPYCKKIGSVSGEQLGDVGAHIAKMAWRHVLARPLVCDFVNVLVLCVCEFDSVAVSFPAFHWSQGMGCREGAARIRVSDPYR